MLLRKHIFPETLQS